MLNYELHSTWSIFFWFSCDFTILFQLQGKTIFIHWHLTYIFKCLCVKIWTVCLSPLPTGTRSKLPTERPFISGRKHLKKNWSLNYERAFNSLELILTFRLRSCFLTKCEQLNKRVIFFSIVYLFIFIFCELEKIINENFIFLWYKLERKQLPFFKKKKKQRKKREKNQSIE